MNENLVIGFLGMSDNQSTKIVLKELEKNHINLSFIILQVPNASLQLKRFKRKLKLSGPILTIKRIVQTLWHKKILRKYPKTETGIPYLNISTEYVTSVNSEDCRGKIKAFSPDIIILCTDELITRKTFLIPRLGCLNAHPGWIPAYRGLGSLIRQVGDGFRPAISVHFVDEGIDTGPLLLREEIDVPITAEGEWDEIAMCKEQARLFTRVINKLKNNKIDCIDTFLETSNLSKGFGYKRARSILMQAKKNWKNLKSPRSIY